MSEGSQIRGSFERRRPLVHEVRDELERIILEGEVAAGERLDESTLAELMGVSRGPVREAARSLERDGLVTAVANRGVFVRSLSLQETLELYDLRAMIAGYLCAELARTADAALHQTLQVYLHRMDEAIAEQDESAYFLTNLAFHDHIAAAAAKPRSCALYTALGKEVRLFRLRVLSGRAALELSNSEHRRLVDAITRGDAQAARDEGAQHHLNGKQRLLASLEAGAEDPAG
ncbi:GntR family transcriptional regulator [Maliponia aquimaris]|uniref:HTH-type transcriptional regulator Mce2R n=1 Tax=Maliponia aquimaris TaxID=1673631 RepID=A0A238KNN4_9RHOB|nr:FCD domain-containing protein [Maliponia aquimaris]SMX44464.1 HTH-type transcriptional regulator Mce2R [Maliponia aquimaris]